MADTTVSDPLDPRRAELAADAADAIERAQPSNAPAMVGFDGFIDSIIRVVDRRGSLAPEDYRPIETISGFAERCAAAAGRSANMEMVVTERRFGGNGPLMAGALGRLGAPTTYLGAVGSPEDPTVLDPIYAPFAERCERVVPVAEPGLTDALEFVDGKLMMGKPANVQDVTWELLMQRPGIEAMRKIVGNSALIGIVNWTMMAGIPGIWRGLIDEVFPHPPERPGGRRVSIDLADPAKRTDGDVREALDTLRAMNELVPVTLGINRAECERIDAVVRAGAFATEHERLSDTLRTAAETLRAALGLDTLVVHAHRGAAGANAEGDVAWFDAPYTRTPRISTGAGDHFNGGFGFAQIHARDLGLSMAHCLAIACGTSGAYVRDGQSPTRERLVELLRDLPIPE
ncbi:MAG: hypothetical protein AAGG07_00545 [Planctomycetota bacterium]